MKQGYKVCASVYKNPEQETLMASLILILNEKGKLVDYLPWPATISDYGRFSQKKAKNLVRECVADSFKISVGIDAIELVIYKKLDKTLFKLENK